MPDARCLHVNVHIPRSSAFGFTAEKIVHGECSTAQHTKSKFVVCSTQEVLSCVRRGFALSPLDFISRVQQRLLTQTACDTHMHMARCKVIHLR